MKSRSSFNFQFLLTILFLSSCSKSKVPTSFHPENPHYFLFREKLTILVGSTEHYGAVLNLDFDYVTYLDELAAADHENGTFRVENGQPGGGGINLRSQFKILIQVLSEIDFLKMRPNDSILQCAFAKPATARALIHEGNQYLIYINDKKADNDSLARHEKSLAFSINLPKGDYSAKWINTLTGERIPFDIKGHEGGEYKLETPAFIDDIALMIRK